MFFIIKRLKVITYINPKKYQSKKHIVSTMLSVILVSLTANSSLQAKDFDNSISTEISSSKPSKINTPIDFAEGSLYILDSIDKKDMEVMALYDKHLLKINAVDVDYKYTDINKVTTFYSIVKKTSNRNGKKNIGRLQKITEFSPYQLTIQFTEKNSFDDTDIMMMNSWMSSPSLIKALCERAYTSKVFRANNLQMTYRYLDKKEKLITNIDLNNKVCKGTMPIKNYQPIKQTPDEQISVLKKSIDIKVKARIDNASEEQKNSFYYLLAMNSKVAHENERGLKTDSDDDAYNEIIKIGQSIVEKINLVEDSKKLTTKQKSKLLSKINNIRYDKVKNISLPEQEKLFCSMNIDIDCVNQIKNSSKDWKKLIEDNQLILKRYQSFLQQIPAINQFKHHNIYNPMPNYNLLYMGHRVNNIQALQLAKSGQPQKALNQLVVELNQLRAKFAAADDLIFKSVINRLVAHQLQTIVMINNYTNKPLSFKSIKQLTTDEMNMELVLFSEYKSQYYIFAHAINPTNSPSSKKFFQINQTLNVNAEIFTKLIERTKISPSQLAVRMQKDESFFEKIINIDNRFSENNKMGKQLITASLISIDHYHVGFFKLNNMINATNHVMTDGKVALTNVFAPTVSGVTKTADKICYDLPVSAGSNESKNSKKQSCMFL